MLKEDGLLQRSLAANLETLAQLSPFVLPISTFPRLSQTAVFYLIIVTHFILRYKWLQQMLMDRALMRMPSRLSKSIGPQSRSSLMRAVGVLTWFSLAVENDALKMAELPKSEAPSPAQPSLQIVQRRPSTQGYCNLKPDGVTSNSPEKALHGLPIPNPSMHASTQTEGYADPKLLRKWLGEDFLNKSTWFSRRPTMLGFNIMMALIVLGVNSWALAYLPRFRSDTEDVGTLWSGDCSKTKISNALIHVAINILSSALLAASNFSMQILVAPTRDMINEAHSKKKWVQVGVPSVRNLARIEWYRCAIWLCMALSSVPLHFL